MRPVALSVLLFGFVFFAYTAQATDRRNCGYWFTHYSGGSAYSEPFYTTVPTQAELSSRERVAIEERTQDGFVLKFSIWSPPGQGYAGGSSSFVWDFNKNGYLRYNKPTEPLGF